MHLIVCKHVFDVVFAPLINPAMGDRSVIAPPVIAIAFRLVNPDIGDRSERSVLHKSNHSSLVNPAIGDKSDNGVSLSHK